MLPRNVRLIVLGVCTGISSSVLAQHADTPATQVAKTPYAVEELVLGDKVDPDTVTSRTYHCSPSEQFVGSPGVRTGHPEVEDTRPIQSYIHGMTKLYTPTKHWSRRFLLLLRRKRNFNEFRKGLVRSPEIIDMPHRSGLPDGMIAVWGDVVLTPVDADNVKKLAEGKAPKLGFMVDFVADFERSARKGLPVYRIGGGPGLLLAVSYGNPDRGTLRLIAVDASKFASQATEQPQRPVAAQPSPTQDQPAAAAKLSPTQDQATIAAQPSPTPDRTDIASKPALQPTSASNESQANIADLKHTISLLKADLANATAKISKLETQNVETERQLRQEAEARLSADAAKTQIEQTMVESEARYRSSRTGFWTILASMAIGGFLALMAVRSPTLRNQRNTFKLASKLPNNLTVWARRVQGRYHPKELFERELDKHVADINVTTQPREAN